MNTPPNAGRRKKGGLGGLLTSPSEPVPLTEGQEAIELPGAPDPAPQEASPPAPARPATPARPVPGATLPPARRARREPREKLTCSIPLSVMEGLDALVERDGRNRYDEVTEALRAHLYDKGIDTEEG